MAQGASRRSFGMRGIVLLDEIAARQDKSLDDDEALAIAIAEIRAARAERRAESS